MSCEQPTSVDKDDLGNYLVSGGNTHSLLYIAGNNGSVLWRLGGKQSSFKGNGTGFSGQHGARFVGDADTYAQLAQASTNGTRLVALFNNADPQGGGQQASAQASSAWLVRLNMTSMAAELLLSSL